MDRLLQDFSAELQAHQGAPCLSLYQPTHRAMAGRQQDALRFRNLVDELEASLQRDYAKRDVGPLIKPFRALADDAGFWRGTMRDGLAVLGSAELFRVYHLQRPVPELAVAAGSFHVKPLIRILQSADRYHVLGVDRERIRLFEGNRDQLDELELPAGFPRTSQDVLGERENQRYVGAWAARAGQAGVLHGAGSDSDIVDTAMERFFRAVDQAVLEQYSRPPGRPLLLAGLPENLGRFRAFSRNPFVLEASIGVHPDTLAPEALREQAWRAIEPTYLARLQGWWKATRPATRTSWATATSPGGAQRGGRARGHPAGRCRAPRARPARPGQRRHRARRPAPPGRGRPAGRHRAAGAGRRRPGGDGAVGAHADRHRAGRDLPLLSPACHPAAGGPGRHWVAPRASASSRVRARSASLLARRWVGQPCRCSCTSSASATIQTGLSFRHGM